jgi:hypothetical protein
VQRRLTDWSRWNYYLIMERNEPKRFYILWIIGIPMFLATGFSLLYLLTRENILLPIALLSWTLFCTLSVVFLSGTNTNRNKIQNGALSLGLFFLIYFVLAAILFNFGILVFGFFMVVAIVVAVLRLVEVFPKT